MYRRMYIYVRASLTHYGFARSFLVALYHLKRTNEVHTLLYLTYPLKNPKDGITHVSNHFPKMSQSINPCIKQHQHI